MKYVIIGGETKHTTNISMKSFQNKKKKQLKTTHHSYNLIRQLIAIQVINMKEYRELIYTSVKNCDSE